MPQPTNRIAPQSGLREVEFASPDPRIAPLPALPLGDEPGTILTRWRFTLRERLRLLITGDLFIAMQTYYEPHQPVAVFVKNPLADSRAGME